MYHVASLAVATPSCIRVNMTQTQRKVTSLFHLTSFYTHKRLLMTNLVLLRLPSLTGLKFRLMLSRELLLLPVTKTHVALG